MMHMHCFSQRLYSVTPRVLQKGAGAGLVFVSPLGVRMRYMVHIHFPTSNNVAKYEALINGLRITIELGIRWLNVQGDS